MVILISAMRQGPTPRRVHELSTLFGVDRATVARWQTLWRDSIPQRFVAVLTAALSAF